MEPEASGVGLAWKEPKPRAKRRRFDQAWKRDVVEQALRPGASIAKIARANDLNTNQLFKWCRQHESALGGVEAAAPMLPVVIDEKDGSTPAAETCMIVKLARGSLRFEGPVDLDVLRTLVQALTTR